MVVIEGDVERRPCGGPLSQRSKSGLECRDDSYDIDCGSKPRPLPYGEALLAMSSQGPAAQADWQGAGSTWFERLRLSPLGEALPAGHELCLAAYVFGRGAGQLVSANPQSRRPEETGSLRKYDVEMGAVASLLRLSDAISACYAISACWEARLLGPVPYLKRFSEEKRPGVALAACQLCGHRRYIWALAVANYLCRGCNAMGTAPRLCGHHGRCPSFSELTVAVDGPSLQKRPRTPCNEGEADNPGPRDQITVGSANVTSLRKRWPIASKWDFDILAARETKLGEEAQMALAAQVREDGWEPIWGEPMPLRDRVREGNTVGLNVNDAKHGGVAVLAKRDQPIQQVKPSPSHEHLFEEGRLVHSFVPWERGDSGIHVLSMYGCANAETM